MIRLNQLKEEANSLFQNKKFVEAIDLYQQIIDSSDGENEIKSIASSNQSASYYQLKKWKESEATAKKSIEFNDKYIKAYYRLVQALLAQDCAHKRKKAKIILLNAMSSKKINTSEKLPLVQQYRQIEESHLENYYEKILKSVDVEVKYDSDKINNKKWMELFLSENHENIKLNAFYCPAGVIGKGVFSKKTFQAGEVIAVEIPICDQLKINKKNIQEKICNHCLFHTLSYDKFEQLQPTQYFKNIFAQMQNENRNKNKETHCGDCGMYFCSEECKNIAWTKYHKLYCHRNSLEPSFFQLAIEKELCNPLLIGKMFAYVILSYLHFRSSAKRNPDFIDDFTEIDFGVFEYFECQPQESELDSLFADSIKKIIIENSKIHAIYDVSIPSLYFDNLLTLENYRKFYAMIQRNAQEIQPITSFHSYLACMSKQEQQRTMKYLSNLPSNANVEFDLNEFIQTNEFLRDLSVVGASSMLQIGNCMNHSCYPNVVAACGHSDSRIQYIACRDIQKGEELVRSYIDETRPYAARQDKLSSSFGFKCYCTLCIQEQKSK